MQKKEETPAADADTSVASSADDAAAKSSSPAMTDAERAKRRAERFGVSSDAAKKNQRAERFGTSNNSSPGGGKKGSDFFSFF